MISALFTLLIYLIIFGVIWWAVDYAIAHLPIPNPPANLIRIVLVVIFAFILIALLLGLAGTPIGGLDLPRVR